jgi:hypothetical protein
MVPLISFMLLAACPSYSYAESRLATDEDLLANFGWQTPKQEKVSN